jgi:hypothetical protein
MGIFFPQDKGGRSRSSLISSSVNDLYTVAADPLLIESITVLIFVFDDHKIETFLNW